MDIRDNILAFHPMLHEYTCEMYTKQYIPPFDVLKALTPPLISSRLITFHVPSFRISSTHNIIYYIYSHTHKHSHTTGPSIPGQLSQQSARYQTLAFTSGMCSIISGEVSVCVHTNPIYTRPFSTHFAVLWCCVLVFVKPSSLKPAIECGLVDLVPSYRRCVDDDYDDDDGL